MWPLATIGMPGYAGNRGWTPSHITDTWPGCTVRSLAPCPTGEIYEKVNAVLARINASHQTLHPQDAALEARAQSFEMAYRMQLEATDAFDISREPISTREMYGDTVHGRQCLIARRLIEAGARFVMVDYGYDPDYGNLWDNHNVPLQKMPHISKMAMRGYHVAGIDKAFAALISDLKERG